MIHTTANHPWLSADRGWIVAGKLQLGEPVRRVDGSMAVVVALTPVHGSAPMWDLTVSQVHDFAVGNGAYVVHNCSDIVKARQRGVARAWREEYQLVKETGEGTREWTPAEKAELLSNSKRPRVRGYEGHHINSVDEFPELADNPDDIEFLNRAEHQRAHPGGNWRRPSGGLEFIYRRSLIELHRLH